MSKDWGSPEPNDFEFFLQRSVSNNELPTRENSVDPTRKAKSATPSPMPKPKIQSDFVAWGEYTGIGKDEDFIAWKKRQLGELKPANQSSTGRGQSTQTQQGGRRKENKVSNETTAPQGTSPEATKQDHPPSRKPSHGPKIVKQGQT